MTNNLFVLKKLLEELEPDPRDSPDKAEKKLEARHRLLALAGGHAVTCPNCRSRVVPRFARGGEVDTAQRALEREIDEAIDEDEDDEDERRLKHGLVHVGVSAAREVVGLSDGGAVGAGRRNRRR